MTNTNLPRFARDNTIGEVSCYGRNHHDHAAGGHCVKCGQAVAKREDGRIFNIHYFNSESGYEKKRIVCWEGTHECNPERIARHEAAVAVDIEAGRKVIGQTVRVIRGRKVPKGTEGVIFWIGEDHYSDFMKLGIRDADGTAHFVREDYVEVV